ncbi:craniofacial development protein 2-like [Nilaparvata lugens]|uniref:craniofacial development protein 2-like n=1 Tax=Nilaparvata lugens TaxID=108931 RepID=UPI00193D7A76|nr:craniofacial development protein 2-like [Nilaparvata lugens]
MLQAGKMAEISNKVKRCKMDVVALQEVRWKGSGRIDKKDYSVLYSGNEERAGRHGTAFIINAKVRHRLLAFWPVSERMCKIRIKGRFRNLTIIFAYAPTEEATDEDKDTFYESLARECAKAPKYDMLVVLGNFNAKVGKEPFLKGVSGKHTLHEETSENGRRLAELAVEQALMIASTMFRHKRINLGTWKMPGSNIVNQIDHVLISKRHTSSVENVRVLRGPNFDSVHYMLKATILEKLASGERRLEERRTRWNVDNFHDDGKKEEFQTRLEEQIEVARGQVQRTDNVGNVWYIMKDTIKKVAKKVIGERREGRNIEWFDDECRAIIEQKNQCRVAMIQRETRRKVEAYKESRRIAKRLIRRKRKNI